MEKRTVGKSPLGVSPIGLGLMSMSGAYGEANVDVLWLLSSKPVRYMLGRSIVTNEVNALAASGDQSAADNLLIACQGFALHGTKGPAWGQLERVGRASIFA